jgi:enterochelin esterase family protein
LTIVTEHEIPSELLATHRRAIVHAPDLTFDHSTSGDVFIFLDGELYLDRVKAPAQIAAAIEQGQLPPATCIYLPNTSAAARHVEYTCHAAFAAFLARELPRWIAENIAPGRRLFLCGLSLSGLQAIFTACRSPESYSGILSQSPSAWSNDEWLASSLVRQESSPVRYRVSVGLQELQENVVHPPSGLVQKTSQLASVRRLASRLQDTSHTTRFTEYEGGHDPVCWEKELVEALAWLTADELAPATSHEGRTGTTPA